MSGSLSLIIVLIVVVWAIVLAPMVFGDSKPIRRSGEGYDETRVLHQGGTTDVQGRRRPRVTKADIHHFDDYDNDYEVVEPVKTDSGSTSWKKLSAAAQRNVIDADPEPEALISAPCDADANLYPESEADPFGFSEDDDTTEYELDGTYFSPEDFGYSTVVTLDADESADLDADVDADLDADVEADTDTENESAAELDGEDDLGAEDLESETDAEAEFDESEISYARARRGRGGWDPETAQRAREDRARRRQRTITGLAAATIIAAVFAFVAGGWAWAAPTVTAVLLAWYLVALRTQVKQERELHARRMRQLHRARLGVVSSEEGAPVPAHMRRPGAVIVELDDESADFAHVPTYRRPIEQIDEPDTRYRDIA
nr:Uncharacterised protein [Streptococcus thermophilus]